MPDIIDQFAATIRQAAANRAPLCICGGGTKDFYGGSPQGTEFPVAAYRGIVDYEPSELVLTARAGTPVAEIEAALAERGQMLAFEPPHFDRHESRLPSPLAPLPHAGEGNVLPAAANRRVSRSPLTPLPHAGEGNVVAAAANRSVSPSPLAPLPQAGEGNVVAAAPQGTMGTLGGCVAAGLSGPRRASAGSIRDFVLGVRLLDGRGNDLRFGGQVMKNVAGFDVSRLIAGSLGTLGVVLEVSLKVLPLPIAEATLRFEKTAAEAISLANAWAGQPLPLSATAWHAGELTVRLSGASAAVNAAAAKLGGERVDATHATRFWRGVRDHGHDFFSTAWPLWRLSIKPTTPPLEFPGTQFIEWGGALRWLAGDIEVQTVRAAAAAAGGHATLFRGGEKSAGVFQPLPPALMTIHRNLKRAFDPAGIFNPGRMYEF